MKVEKLRIRQLENQWGREKTTEPEASAVIVLAINVAASALFIANIDDEAFIIGGSIWRKHCRKTDQLPCFSEKTTRIPQKGVLWSMHYAIYKTPILAFCLPVLRHIKTCQGSFIWQWCLWFLHTGCSPVLKNQTIMSSSHFPSSWAKKHRFPTHPLHKKKLPLHQVFSEKWWSNISLDLKPQSSVPFTKNLIVSNRAHMRPRASLYPTGRICILLDAMRWDCHINTYYAHGKI